ncbi:thioredoxin domain-containing protein [Methanoregula sp. UBA64]|uniref:thioredoxin domain-containing protein n=1 Tax=Methanoregula sp. UBA64 TaxID=1915554 RepID=UPI0025D0AE2C|nr:thioredoxin domain-containing protein [Methanoregula sp. UBA64]
MPGTATPKTGRPANRLAREKSPYLLQHAHNPVDWYPWGDEAFLRAKSEDKPVFLSIGYSTCHWCHVMAHECFEDEGVAAILNRDFVSIKVDREERPDIDSVYMEICQQMTGQGGWPLTIIMTPDKLPFFAGTYFPRDSTPAMPGLTAILERVAEVWHSNRDELARSAKEISTFAGTLPFVVAADTPGRALLENGYRALAAQFDKKNAGFGNAPKFPAPHILIFLLRYGHLAKKPDARLMAERTLDAIYAGGTWDHVGGGLHRYATDAGWRIPHFEKMLYDQALFVLACTEAYEATKNERFRRMAGECIAYVFCNLRDPGGAFYTAEDADSPGGEGAYYTWTRDELDATGAGSLFTLTPLPADGRDRKEPRFILSRSSPNNPAIPDPVREQLRAIREKRARPARDDKILTDTNALFCQALARAGRAFDEPEYTRAAEAAMGFLLAHLAGEDGTLFHRYRDGERAVPAFADDYAQVIAALIALYEATFDPVYLTKARQYTGILRNRYGDPREGGFFTVAEGTGELFARKKEWYDGAYPSANATAYGALSWLARTTRDPDIRASAQASAMFLAGAAGRAPAATAAYLAELARFSEDAAEQIDLVIAGDPASADTRALITAARSRYLPGLITILKPPGNAGEAIDALVPAARGRVMQAGRATAYVCGGHTCRPPVQDPEELRWMLEKIGR